MKKITLCFTILLLVSVIIGQNFTSYATIDQEFCESSVIVVWDGVNDSGHNVRSGIYLYKITTDELSTTKKMILLK